MNNENDMNNTEWHQDWDSYWEHLSEYPQDGLHEVELLIAEDLEQSCILN